MSTVNNVHYLPQVQKLNEIVKDISNHFLENYKTLLGVAKRNVVDNCSYVAEECVQQSYTKLIETVKSNVDSVDKNFDGLMFRILFNEIYDSNDRELKRGMTGAKPKERLYGEDDIETVSNEDNISLDLFEKVCLNIVMDNTTSSNSSKDVLVRLFFIEGYTHKELAAKFNVNEKTSRNIVYNFLQELRDGEW